MKDKYKNIKKLKTIRAGKAFFYPFLRLISNNKLLSSFIFFVSSKLKYNSQLTNILQYLQYQNYAKYFQRINNIGSNKKIMYFHMSGVNSVHTFISMLLSSYLSRKGFYNYILYCNQALELCSQDRIFKTREDFVYQCELCIKGFEELKSARVLNPSKLNLEKEDFFLQFKEYRRIYNILSKTNNSTELLSINLEDFEIGKFVSYRVMRYYFRGYLKNDERETQIFKKYILETLKFYYLFKKHLKNYKPEYAIIHNGSFNFGNVIRYLLEKESIPYITYETFIGNNSLIYKKNGEVMRLRWDEEYLKFKNKTKDIIEIQKMEEQVTEFMSKIKDGSVMYAQLNKQDTHIISGEEKFCVLFTNLNFDSAVIGRHTLFNSMTDWIKETVKFWIENVEGIKLYIRIHPGEKKLVTPSEDFVSSILNGIYDSKIEVIDATEDISSYELINKMKFGLIYSSTIGLEILYYGKECVVAGDPFFLSSGLVDRFSSKNKYFQKLLFLVSENQVPITKERKKEIITYLYFFYFLKIKRIEGCCFNLKAKREFLLENSVEKVLDKNSEFFDKFYSELTNNTGSN